MGNTNSQPESPDMLGQEGHSQSYDHDHDHDHDHDNLDKKRDHTNSKLLEYIAHNEDSDSSDPNPNPSLKYDPYNLNPSSFAFSSQVQDPQSTGPLARLPHRRQHHQRRISHPGPKPDHDATDVAEAADATDNALNDAPPLDEQPNSSPSSPVLKFEPPEPSEPPTSLSPPPLSDPNSDSSALRSARQRLPFSEAKPDPYLLHSLHSYPDAIDNEEEEDGGQEQMHSTARVVGKLSKRKKKARRRQEESQAPWNAPQTRKERSDTGDGGGDGDVSDAPNASTLDSSIPYLDILPRDVVSSAKSSKKRKRKSSQHDESAVRIPQTEPSETPVDPPPASKKRKSKGGAKTVRKAREDTPDEMQNSQNGHELDTDVDMHEAPASPASPDDPDSTGNSFEDLAQSIYDDHLRSKNLNADQPTPPDPTSPASNVEQVHEDTDSAQEDTSAAARHTIQSDILGEDLTSDTHGLKNDARAMNDDTSEVESTSSNESSSDDEAAKPQGIADPADALNVDQQLNDLGQAAEDDDSSSALSSHPKEHATPNGDLSEQVEVPSSVPIQDDRLAFTAPGQRTRPKSSTALRKPTSRSAAKASGQEVGEIASPAAAAASRKRGRQAVIESPAPAPATGPKLRQRRLTSMVGDASTSAGPRSTPVRSRKDSKVIKGAFTKFELEAIDQAVARWQEDHGLTKYQVNELVQGDPRLVDSMEFWDTIHAACPNRVRQKILNVCRRRHHNFVARGTWTPEQSEELAQMFELHGPKHSLIAKLINRLPEDVRDRYRNYVVCGDNRRRNNWTREEEERLNLVVHLSIEHIRNMQREGKTPAADDPEELIDWQQVSQQMGRTRSRQQCMGKWRSLQFQRGDNGIDGVKFSSIEELVEKARAEAETMTDRDRYELLKAIRTSKVQAESRIPWVRIRRDLLGRRWSRPALMVAWNRLRRLSDKWRSLAVGALTKELCRLFKSTKSLPYPDLSDSELGAELQRIKYIVNSRIIRGLVDKNGAVVDGSDDGEETNEKPEEEGESKSGEDINVAVEDAPHSGERMSSVDLGFGENNIADDNSDNEASRDEIQDSEPEPEPEPEPKPSKRQPGSSRKARVDARNGESDPLRGGSTSGSSRKSSKKKKASAANAAAPISSAQKLLARRKARKSTTATAGKRLKRSAYDNVDSDSDAQSSDTNASEVESIPAH